MALTNWKKKYQVQNYIRNKYILDSKLTIYGSTSYLKSIDISKHFSYLRLTRKVLQFKKYIMPPFKIDLNISVICKTIKIDIPTRKTKTPTKREEEHPQEGIKTPTKGITKTN